MKESYLNDTESYLNLGICHVYDTKGLQTMVDDMEQNLTNSFFLAMASLSLCLLDC